MKTAILFDFIEGRAGGEKLLLFLANKFDADIYTGYVNWNETYKDFEKFDITTLDNIPRLPLLKQEMLIRNFRKLDLSGYDKIICLGLYSIYAAKNNRGVIWYPYGVSPFFQKRAGFPKGFIDQNFIWKVGAWLLTKRTKSYNKRIVQENIEKIVTISEYSRNSFFKYYARDSTVIPPPVDMNKYYWKPSRGYYLIVSRLMAGKRVELSIKAFKLLPEKKLIIEGDGPIKEKLMRMANGCKNITFLGRIPSENLPKLYSECIAFIGTSFYDDWSMPMVEALASGKPCIAVNQGAYPEIVNKDVGILVEGIPEGIIYGVNFLGEKEKNKCIKRAKQWSIEEFGRSWDKVCR